jgi:hypothetical protein
MKWMKTIMISIILLVNILGVQPGLPQGVGEKAVSFSGFIEIVPNELTYIVVYETKVFLSDAKIVDETGNPLKASDLVRNLYISVDGVQRSKDVYAKKITVNKSRKPPAP